MADTLACVKRGLMSIKGSICFDFIMVVLFDTRSFKSFVIAYLFCSGLSSSGRVHA